MSTLSTRSLIGAAALATLALALSATPALAAPSWGITLTATPSELPRTDERMEFVAAITNTGDVSTSSPFTLSFEGPSGSEQYIYEAKTASGGTAAWSCPTIQQPSASIDSSATCIPASGAVVQPNSSYSEVRFVVTLGHDAPDHGVGRVTVSGGGAATAASAEAAYDFEPGPGFPFGILELSPGHSSFEAGVFDTAAAADTTAGGHPFRAYTTFGFNTHVQVNGEVGPTDNIKDTVVDAARGFVGNALTAPVLCKTVEEVILTLCPDQSAVGGIDIYAVLGNSKEPIYPGLARLSAILHNLVIYSLEPEFGSPAQFAFGIKEGETPYTFVPELRADEGYAISFRTAPIITVPALHGTNVTLCGYGPKIKPKEEIAGFLISVAKFEGCKEASDPTAYPHPLATNPTRCTGVLAANLKVDSWQHPEEVRTTEYPLPQSTECDAVPFEPQSQLTPTNHEADTPTGLGVEFTMPTEGLLSNVGVSQANLDNVTVTFPKGMSVNPASADGLGACSLAQIKLHSNAPDECPASSKVGTIEIDTPIIRKTLTGNIYIAQQNHNPFSAPLGLYMVFASARDGVRIKIAGKLTPDPVTGQLVSTFVENPEAPFSRLALHFNEGPRAPLINPPRCGTYAIHSEFSPWSAVNPANPTAEETVSQDSTYEVTAGPNGSPCPNGALQPKMNAGLQKAQAGAKSPFVFTLSREDGSQRLTGLNVTTPKGLTAYLRGIPYCPDATLAGISMAEETGRSELERPACPAASQVGTVLAGAGSGPDPFQASGKVYLAGPYKGAPVSLAVVTPAVAGPFDLGNVVIRNALYVDPETAQVTAKSDPIPTILHGLLLDVRQIRLALDRPDFTAAPTNCEPMSVDAHVSGQEGGQASPSNRFQVGDCAALGFKPQLALRLFGGTHRSSHPRLVATLTARPGDANIAGASVALPHSEFLDQAHIGTVCTRVQFAAHQCPAASIYGEAEARTPLLDSPVRGPVYLRSSDNPLPDLVAALRGPDNQPIEVVLDGRIDSVHGGIRSTFEAVPDQPVSSFILNMQGGKKGLLVNSRNLCNSVNRATAVFTAQNGRTVTLKPKLQNACPKAAKKHRRYKHHSTR